MFIFFYYLIWTLAIIFCIPVIRLLGKKRFAERMALDLPSSPIEGASIWIHGLSVGEVISALPLVDCLGRRYPNRGIVFTVTTRAGMAIAQNELKGKVRALINMPLDFWWCIRRIVNYINPSIFILVETDIWPGLLNHLRRRGIKTILVNGRISPRTFRRYSRFAFFARKLFEPFDLCLMDTDLDAARLFKVGIGPAEKIRTVGNIKFDREWGSMSEEEYTGWLSLFDLNPDDMVWVAGSTHPGEDRAILRVFKRLHISFATLHLIIAPRAIEQSGEICKLSRKMGLRTVLKTEISNNKGPYDVIVVNTLGELGRIYGLGNVSFVGGSLEPNGGHNLLEPASLGCPVLFGPHTDDFDLMSELLIEAGGGWRVNDGGELFDAIEILLRDGEKRTKMGRLAKQFVEENRGALDRIMSYVGAYIDELGGLN